MVDIMIPVMNCVCNAEHLSSYASKSFDPQTLSHSEDHSLFALQSKSYHGLLAKSSNLTQLQALYIEKCTGAFLSFFLLCNFAYSEKECD